MLLIVSSTLLGQDQSDQESKIFEVASVKPNKSGSLSTNQTISKGRYSATNLSVMDLLAISDMPTRSRIIGGPSWIASDRFDILAKADGAATGVTLPLLGRLLMPWLDQREVRDRTGLDGRFDVTLTFTPDRPLRIPPNAPDDLRRAIEGIDPSGPSLFTAVQEQLGLKLEPTKAPMDVIVVDHVEQPTPD